MENFDVKICQAGHQKFLVSFYCNKRVAYSFYATISGLLYFRELINLALNAAGVTPV